MTGQNKDQNMSVSLLIDNLKNLGNYKLSSQNTNYGRIFQSIPDINYYTSSTKNGIVTITKLDLNNKIISGTFEFTAEDEKNPANTIKVTDGWFDISYQ
jgi:hypothetical protein